MQPASDAPPGASRVQLSAKKKPSNSAAPRTCKKSSGSGCRHLEPLDPCDAGAGAAGAGAADVDGAGAPRDVGADDGADDGADVAGALEPALGTCTRQTAASREEDTEEHGVECCGVGKRVTGAG